MILIHELIFSVMTFDLKNTLLCQNYVESNIIRRQSVKCRKALITNQKYPANICNTFV